MTAIKRAEARMALFKEAAAIVEQLRTTQAEHDRLLAQRASKCRELREAGASIADLQDVFGISRSRVQQILRGTRM